MNVETIKAEDVMHAIEGLVTGLALEDVSFETSEKTTGGLAAGAGLFQDTPTHIPNLQTGRTMRTQLVLVRVPGPDGFMIKIHWHHSPDTHIGPDGQEGFLHCHPWGAHTIVLSGGYTAKEIKLDADGNVIREETITVKAGDRNHIPYGVYHRIDEIEPNTVTIFAGGATVDGQGWDYFDPTSRQRVSIEDAQAVTVLPDGSNFGERMKEVNPHLIK